VQVRPDSQYSAGTGARSAAGGKYTAKRMVHAQAFDACL
jgi:hypothetical protein